MPDKYIEMLGEKRKGWEPWGHPGWASLFVVIKRNSVIPTAYLIFSALKETG